MKARQVTIAEVDQEHSSLRDLFDSFPALGQALSEHGTMRDAVRLVAGDLVDVWLENPERVQPRILAWLEFTR